MMTRMLLHLCAGMLSQRGLSSLLVYRYGANHPHPNYKGTIIMPWCHHRTVQCSGRASFTCQILPVRYVSYLGPICPHLGPI